MSCNNKQQSILCYIRTLLVLRIFIHSTIHPFIEENNLVQFICLYTLILLISCKKNVNHSHKEYTSQQRREKEKESVKLFWLDKKERILDL